MLPDSRDDAEESGKTSVLARAFSILASFHEGRSGQTLSEISRRSGVPLTTTHRIVADLRGWGALERDARGRYRIGVRLWEVASLTPRSAGLQAIARPYMQDLFETTHYATHLAIREGREAVFIERLRTSASASARPRVGGRYPLHATAVGLVLLANAPEDVQEEVLGLPLQSFTAHTVTDDQTLRASMAVIRNQGFAVSDRQINTSDVSIAAPIADGHGQVVGALSLIIPHERASELNAVHLVRATARTISRAIASAPPSRPPE
jgi:DNA-binding IclR family transcriptional regulator